MRQKIIAVVKFNQDEAFILKKQPIIVYRKYGDLIIGWDKDKIFYNIYENRGYEFGFKAFAGAKFDITLENGDVIHANGQWWGGGHGRAEKILNIELVRVTCSTINDLCKCYVYHGDAANKKKIEKLRAGYKGKVWGYWEYQKEVIKKLKKESINEKEKAK